MDQGVSSRFNVEFTIDDTAVDNEGRIERHENTDWAKQFDLVLYNNCFAEMDDDEWTQRIVYAHLEYDVPAVVLHCAMHSYNRFTEDDSWLKFIGVRTYRHQSRKPFTVEILESEHPLMANFPDNWTTPEGELYNILEVYDITTPLAHAYDEDTEEYQVNIWVNEYHNS